MRIGIFVTALAVTGLLWCQSAPRLGGYLGKAEMPEVLRIVPPAPAAGDPRFTADMAIFHATRSMEGSPRWALAQADDNVTLAGLYKAFSCSLGITLTRANAPKTTELVTRAMADAASAANTVKQAYQHKRPFQVEDAKVCVSPAGRAALERNPDYPSGHTAASWEVGLVLSELVPDETTTLLARARAFGQSRVVCGVHNASAVEAGWMTASSVFAAQNASPAFRADVEAARPELTALLAKSPKPEGCDLEQKTLSVNPY
ncbi:MAG TPA: phosphatase PAP2 family protein [Bryobacteraceae bacterium]|jgi:acid phosphatase (class A)